jgi:hypothetical protein
MSLYPVASRAAVGFGEDGQAPGGLMVAVRLADLASPLRNGGRVEDGDRSALVDRGDSADPDRRAAGVLQDRGGRARPDAGHGHDVLYPPDYYRYEQSPRCHPLRRIVIWGGQAHGREPWPGQYARAAARTGCQRPGRHLEDDRAFASRDVRGANSGRGGQARRQFPARTAWSHHLPCWELPSFAARPQCCHNPATLIANLPPQRGYLAAAIARAMKAGR